MQAFGFKKPQLKRTINSLKEEKPVAKVLDSIQDEILQDSESTTKQTRTTPLVIPCIQPLSSPATLPASVTTAFIPTTAGLHVPDNISEPKISRLHGLKRSVADDDGGSDISDAEEFAWGMLRGMGWQGEADAEVSKYSSKKK